MSTTTIELVDQRVNSTDIADLLQCLHNGCEGQQIALSLKIGNERVNRARPLCVAEFFRGACKPDPGSALRRCISSALRVPPGALASAVRDWPGRSRRSSQSVT